MKYQKALGDPATKSGGKDASKIEDAKTAAILWAKDNL